MPAGIVAISYAPFVVLSASGVRASLDAQFGRPLELESLGGSLIVAAHAFFGLHLPDRGSYYELPFASADTVARISVVLGIAVLVGVWLLFLRSSASDVMLLTFAAAALATTLAFGKVFSPQYLLWLIPFVPLVARPRRAYVTALLAGACIVTAVVFPRHWESLEYDLGHPEITAILLRNALVLAIVATLTWPFAHEE